ncbi:hypothetical protein GIB67_015201 [Kingdonia uniflora]|uniref:Mediator of RNA polymerase II transcription subunit 13 n=1 Tax=Kingdonia uniflora TaxID=39325 RepID=A0A7J7MSK1_9MAGN|nr:hypothetical protein GIB67_015201 [Kingdonia uniflora]
MKPPGTAESHALMLPAPDCGDVSSSPCTGVIMDMTDQSLFAGLEFSPFEGQPRPSAITIDDFHDKSQEFTRDGQSSGPGNYSSASTTTAEYDHVLKDEAMISFAPEYKAVQTSVSDLSSSIFRCPYTPRSIKVESSDSSSNYYVYGAEPPSSSCTDEKLDLVLRGKLGLSPRVHYKKHYTQVESVKKGRRRLLSSNCTASLERMTSSFPFSGFSSAPIAFKSVERKSVMEAEHFLLSPKTVLASEVECIMFQAAMCRIRHLVWSSTCNNLSNRGLGSKLTGDQYTADPGPKQDKYYDVKKKDSVPIRIAGDANVAMRDGSLHTPIGVWRSVGNPKGSKPTSSPSIENSSPSLSHSPFQDESSIVAYSRSQPLQELLDCMTLLVQQATSFVDVALDDDGSYGWLALQEQCRRRFSCGPSMVHAGCGGVLASCHSLDGAGVQLPDPLSACVHASSVMSLLQSDVKVALKSAFGNMDGPLTVTDWCKGHCHSSDAGTTFSDSYSVESTAASEGKDSLSTATLAVSEPISPTHSSVASSFLKVCRTSDGARMDETIPNRLNQEICSSESDPCSRLKQTVLALPSPAILVGYQDDWLKTSANSLQLWEKAPLEPYALPKPMTYYVVCPDIDPLTSAAADFFQQLGTVYETCKLGSHTPQNIGGHVDLSSGKSSASGFVLINSPESVKVESSNASVMGSISDYLLALSNGWNLRTFLVSLSNVIKALRLGSSLTINQRECSSGPAMVIYVVCPFSDPSAVLQTVVEASSSLGSTVLSQEKERRSLLYTQVGKSLSCSAAVDEASVSNMVTLSGFSIPKLVLQIVTAEAILGVTSPPLNELVILKEIAFTVYNKARRFARASYNESPGALVRPPLMHSPIPGMWKDCAGPRTTSREGDLDTGFRWDNSSWNRIGGLSCDTNRPFSSDTIIHDDVRYMFEPLFILAEPASSLEQQGVSPCNNVTSESSSRSSGDDGGFMQSSNLGNTEIGASSLLDGGPDYQKTVSSLHCCYGWTEDWRWLVCIWTDSRGELLDSHIFPFGGISSRQDTKGLQHLFVQVLHQACQILSSFSSCDQGAIKPRDIVITRIGFFFELERQEWQKAIYLVGGNEVKKWALQLRRSGATDGISASSNGHQQEMSLVQERPSPSFYNSSQTKASSSGFIKGGGGGGLGQNSTRKQQQIMGGQAALFQWVQSISLVGVSLDHSLNLVFPAETSAYLEGFSPVKSLGSTCSSSTSTNVSASSYIVIPCPSMRYLPTRPLQLPTCLTSESPPLAHLLQSKGCAIPLSTGFVVSKSPHIGKVEEQPSVLSVSLVDYYGPSKQQQLVRGGSKQGGSKVSESSETHLIVQCLAAELHSLSWLTASPAYLERRTALPFHCDIILRLTRLLHFADNHLSQHPDIKL